MSNNTWTASDDQFSIRLTLSDISGFFAKQLMITPGTKAFIMSDGVTLGEVPPGTYTLQSFTERLKIWRSPKMVDVILTPEQDLRLSISPDALQTADHILVRVELRVTLQLDDLGMFVKNLLGQRSEFTAEQLRHWIAPIINQTLREAVRKLKIAELSSPDVRLILQTALRECSEITLARYGLKLNEVHSVTVYNEQYDANCQKIGEACLADHRLGAEKALEEARQREAFEKIERLEREQELDILRENVKLDRSEAEVDLELRRCDTRKQMREAVLSDRFDEVKNAEEFSKFMEEIDKAKLLREDEAEELRNMVAQKGADREKIAGLLALNRKAELDRLEAEIAHGRKVQALESEIELAKIADNAENQKVQTALAASIETEKVRFEDNLQKLQNQHKLNAEAAKFLNESQMAQLLHEQDAAKIRNDTEYEQAVAQARIEDVKRESRRKDQDDALRTQGAMQDLAAKARRDKAELVKEMRQQEHEHEIQKTEARRGMSAAELAAVTDAENARAIAEIEKSKYNAEMQAEYQKQLAELQAKRVEDAQASLDKTLEQMKGITGQAFAAVGQFGAGGAYQGVPGTVPAGAARVVVCGGCRAENSLVSKFCSKCGKEL